jgi:biofilm PGA synthesis lipoprotein PgaB
VSRVLCAWMFLLLCCAMPAQALVVLSYHDVRDQVDGELDADRAAISTRHLVEHFEWLKAHGYVPVSLDQVLAARDGGTALPARAVLLTFDDGLRSAATHVLPLLRAYRYPAVVAVVGRWLDLAPRESIDYAGHPVRREDFLSSAQVRELATSGLVDIASHSYDLHQSVVANPQGGQMPAATTRRWDGTRGYETEAQWRERIRADLARSTQQIEKLTGRAPRAIVWPYGAHSAVSDEIAATLGLRASFSLHGLEQTLAGDDAYARLLIEGNPTAATLAAELRKDGGEPRPLRSVQIDLDAVYDTDPQQQSRNLDALLERVRALGVNQVWLQAFADPDGDGAADAVYFPNRHLPMRADLYSRVAWQLRTRGGVEVFAWMPVLGFVLPDATLQKSLAIAARSHEGRADPPRLDPFRADTRRIVGDIYEDLAVAGYTSGLLFGDDAVLRDDDGLAANAPPAGRARTDALIAFTNELTRHASRWRPNLKTARNVFAAPVLDASAEAHTAHDLQRFAASYDLVALMAMPELENAADPEAWLTQLTATVAHDRNVLLHCVFELQARDWRSGRPIGAERLGARMRLVQQAGARHLAYYPDDFLRDEPALATIRRAISASEHPYPRR